MIRAKATGKLQEEERKKRSVNRECRGEKKVQDKNSINICENKAFPLRKKK